MKVLFRAFFAQLFASESVSSELQLRQALIGVLALLITPGFLLPTQMDPAFEAAVIRYASRPPGLPGLLDPLIRMFATICIAYFDRHHRLHRRLYLGRAWLRSA